MSYLREPSYRNMRITMDRIEAMQMLVAAIDQGSLSAAARKMNVPIQTFSRKIGALEAVLGTKLLIRTSRALMLTDAGAAYLSAARRILEQVEEAEREAAGEFQTPRGMLVLTAPPLFGRMFVLPIVRDFLEMYPEINVRLLLDDRYLNIVDESIDMAVRLGKLPDSDLVATRISMMRVVVCGAPGLIASHGRPRTPEDLRRLPCILNRNQMKVSGWRLRDLSTGAAIEVPLEPRLASSNEAAADAALAGIGFANLPIYQALDALEDGRLEAVLVGYEEEPGPVHVVHAPRGLLPIKMQRFLDFARPRLRKEMERFAPET
jgi:DNA-binding transcriptional LysR family regulator